MLKLQVDRVPPSSTGDTQRDMNDIRDYLNYLQEQINRLIVLLNAEERSNE